MRLAGTARQYSKKAMPQEIAMARPSGQGFFRCQYQASVITVLEASSIRAVVRVCTRGPPRGRG